MKRLILGAFCLWQCHALYAQDIIKTHPIDAQDPQYKSYYQDLNSFKIYQWQAPTAHGLAQGETKDLTLQLDGTSLVLQLESANLIPSGTQRTWYQGSQQTALTTQSYHYKGFVASSPQSDVRLSVDHNGQYSGVIYDYQGDNLHFKTLNHRGKQILITFGDKDFKATVDHECGAPAKAHKAAPPANNALGKSAATADDCVVTEIYLIADAAAVDAFGGTPASTEANMLEVLNLVNGHYEPVGVKFEVAGIFISSDPGGPWVVENTADDQLDAAINWFNSQSLPGDVFTFWSSPDWDFSYAYVGAVCGFFGGNLCAAWGGLTANTLNSNTQSHELGHNFDAPHDANGIMRSTVSNQLATFSNNSINIMTDYIPSIQDVCLDVCVDDCSTFAADAGADETICNGSSVQLQASGGTIFSWSPSTGLDNPGSASPNASPTTTTTYTVTVSNSSGCSDTDQVTVVVEDLPSVDAGADQVLSCSSATVTLDGSASASGAEFSYLWTTTDGNIVSGATSASPQVDQSGTYTLTITNTNTTCEASDAVVVSNDASVPLSLIHI